MNQAGIEIIKRWEGLKLNAYVCPAGKITIGYGNTFYSDGSRVKMGDKVTKAEAEELLNVVVNDFAAKARRLIKVQLNDNQFSAIVSFVFNVGIGNFQRSTLLRKLNSKDFQGAGEEFEKWVFAKGKKLPGLVSRRKDEQKLFFR